MVSIWGMVMSTVGLSVICFAIGYWIWFKTRPKKLKWSARVYQLSEGVIPPIKDRDGKIILDMKLSEIRPYIFDTLVKEELDKGIDVYKLTTLNRTTPAVTTDCVESWGKDKYVNVLYDGDSCTLIKQGYDRKTGKKVWSPLSYDRINALKNDIAIRKDRIKKKADILAAILPYVAIVFSLMAIMGLAYLSITGSVDISKQNTKQTEISAAARIQEAQAHENAILTIYGKNPNDNTLGKQNLNKGEPPKLE